MPLFRSVLSTILSFVFFTMWGPLAYATEKNLWEERRTFAGGKTGRPATLWARTTPADRLAAALPSVDRAVTRPNWTAQENLPSPLLEKHRSLFTALPFRFGRISKITLPQGRDTGRVVVHIQDVHMNPEAQNNIGATLESLWENRQVGLLGLEAAFGPLDLTPLRNGPDRDIPRMVADYYYQKQRISGPIHTALVLQTPPPPLLGVDDEPAYRANVAAYLQSVPHQANVRKTLRESRAALNARRSAANPDLRDALDVVEAFHRGDSGLGQAAEKLSVHARPNEAVLKFLAIHRLEKKLDFQTVETQRADLLRRLANKLNQSQVQELLDSSLAYRSGDISYGAFNKFLKGLCAQNGVRLEKDFPLVADYVRYVLAADAIDPEELFAGMTKLEKDALASCAHTPEDIDLVQGLTAQSLAEKLVDFSLTPEEWKQWVALKHHRPGAPDLSGFERFYLEAHRRDQAMADRLMAGMKTRGAETAALVTGGFHAAGIERRLSDAGIAVVRFTPRLTKAEGFSGSASLGVFTREKMPLEKLFAGEKLFTAPEPAPPHTTSAMQLDAHVLDARIPPPNGIRPLERTTALLGTGRVFSETLSSPSGPFVRRLTLRPGAGIVNDELLPFGGNKFINGGRWIFDRWVRVQKGVLNTENRKALLWGVATAVAMSSVLFAQGGFFDFGLLAIAGVLASPTDEAPPSTPFRPSTWHRRSGGVLAPLFSLPGAFQIGDLGAGTRGFIDQLATSEQRIWIQLPTNETNVAFGGDPSPYGPLTAFGNNPLFISLVDVPELRNEIDQIQAAETSFNDQNAPALKSGRILYRSTWEAKTPFFRIAYNKFKMAKEERRAEFEQFLQDKSEWIGNYGLFMALATEHNSPAWWQWPDQEKAWSEDPIIQRSLSQEIKDHMNKRKVELAEEIRYHQYLQFLYHEQWKQTRDYAHERGVELFGDMPIYVSPASDAGWMFKDNLFDMDPQTGEFHHQTGAPPDGFSESGQNWGGATYRTGTDSNQQPVGTPESDQTVVRFFEMRAREMFQIFDGFRVDHFRGFRAFWSIPKGVTDGRGGQWVVMPPQVIGTILRMAHEAGASVLPEDLGVITPDVDRLTQFFGLGGMKVLSFYKDDPKRYGTPHRWKKNDSAWYGTHDTDTGATLVRKTIRHALYWLGIDDQNWKNMRQTPGWAQIIHQRMIEALYRSPARIAIVQLQDIFSLGKNARVNIPGETKGVWGWRLNQMPSFPAFLKEITQATLRGQRSVLTNEPFLETAPSVRDEGSLVVPEGESITLRAVTGGQVKSVYYVTNLLDSSSSTSPMSPVHITDDTIEWEAKVIAPKLEEGQTLKDAWVTFLADNDDYASSTMGQNAHIVVISNQTSAQQLSDFIQTRNHHSPNSLLYLLTGNALLGTVGLVLEMAGALWLGVFLNPLSSLALLLGYGALHTVVRAFREGLPSSRFFTDFFLTRLPVFASYAVFVLVVHTFLAAAVPFSLILMAAAPALGLHLRSDLPMLKEAWADLKAERMWFQSLLSTSVRTYQSLARRYVDEVRAKRRGGKSSLLMGNTFAHPPTGREAGTYLALDWGGTNVKIRVVHLGTNGEQTLAQEHSFQLTAEETTSNAEQMFNRVAGEFKTFLEKQSNLPDTLPLGFVFSFPMEQSSLTEAKLLRWVKGYSATGVVGQNPAQLLRKALERIGENRIQITALANDTVAALVAGSHRRLGQGKSKSTIGLILGTGFNVSVEIDGVLYNTESANFEGSQSLWTQEDRDLDAALQDPPSGVQITEKMLAGKYLGEILRRRILGRTATGDLPPALGQALAKEGSLTTADVSTLAGTDPSAIKALLIRIAPPPTQNGSSLLNDREVTLLREMAIALGRRSARLTASVLAGAIRASGEQESVVTVDGSLYEKFPGYRQMLREALVEIMGAPGRRVQFVFIKDATPIGVAVMAATAATRPPTKTVLTDQEEQTVNEILKNVNGNPLKIDLENFMKKAAVAYFDRILQDRGERNDSTSFREALATAKSNILVLDRAQIQNPENRAALERSIRDSANDILLITNFENPSDLGLPENQILRIHDAELTTLKDERGNPLGLEELSLARYEKQILAFLSGRNGDLRVFRSPTLLLRSDGLTNASLIHAVTSADLLETLFQTILPSRALDWANVMKVLSAIAQAA